jgi:predicted secreted protein
MNWFEGIASFVVIWWIVLFAVLPFGVRPVEKGDIGHAAGAPANPRLWFKAGVTTLVAIVVWLGVFALVNSNVIQFRQP